jgi:hypothetical protein
MRISRSWLRSIPYTAEVVRCAACGCVVSEWAPACTQCSSPLDDAVPVPEEPPAAPPQEGAAAPDPTATAPTHAWRGRISRRWLGAGLAIVAVAGVLTGLALTRAPRSSLPEALKTYTVLYAGAYGVRAVPLDGRPARTLATSPTSGPLKSSDGAVFLHGGWAYYLPAPFTGTPRALVTADEQFPMAWPGVVGVGRQSGSGDVTVEFVEVEGGAELDAPIGELPAGYRPVAQFLAIGPGGVLRTWNPGGLRRSLQLGSPLGQAASIVAVSGTAVVWRGAAGCQANGECPLFFADGAGGSGRSIPPPPGHAGYLAGGALSPDGQLVATFIAAPQRGKAQLVLIELASGQITVVAGGIVPIGSGAPGAGWTPDGNFVFFSGPQGPMHCYLPAERRVFRLPVTSREGFVIG